MIAGVVQLQGSPPPPGQQPPADCFGPAAGRAHDVGLRLGASGGIADAFVWIRNGIAPQAAADGLAPVEVVLDSCGFHPRVFGVRVAQRLHLVNRTAQTCTIAANTDDASLFEMTLAPAQSGQTAKLRKSAVMVRLAVEGNSWMRAYAGVVDHPYFAVTDTTGAYTFSALPSGKFTIAVWQERLGQLVSTVSLDEGLVMIVNFPMQMLSLSGSSP